MGGDAVEERLERRRARRAAGRRPVWIAPGEFQALTGDLSVSGAFVMTGRLPKLGTRLRLTFGGLDAEISVDGVVRWVRLKPNPRVPGAAMGMGVEFVAPPESATR